MSTTSSTSSNVASQYSGLMRVSGIASGMDIDGMVSKLMKAEAVPLDQMKQKQQLLQWKRDDYRDMNTALSDLDSTIFSGISMQSTFNKKTVTSSNDSLVTASAVSAANNISTQISVSQLATGASWKAAYTTLPTVMSNTSLSFNVTDPDQTTRTASVNISSGDTIDDVINKFNNSNLGVSMFKYTDPTTNSSYLVMSDNKTGSGPKLQMTQATHDYMKSLGFSFIQDTNTPSSDLADANGNYTLSLDKDGQDAKIKFNGYDMTQKSNNFTISGVNYTLKGVTTTTSGDNPVTISTATDVDSIFNSVKAFVDKYNDVIKKVNDKISEKRNRDYAPLTDDQRSTMNDTQISQWEEKAKSGMLSNDNILSGGLNKMRQDLYSPVTGTGVTNGYTQLSQIGITTSADYTENGKLEIDDTKLKQAIQDNPQAIYQLFNSGLRSNDTSGTYSYSTEGVAKRLRDSISNISSQVTSIAGNTTYTNNQFDIGRQLTDLGTQITDFQSKLTDIENRYYNQFSAMEQAMQQSNQQATYISQQFSSGG
ncbi:MAG: flagellar hook-associated protein 2 [Bacillota bacterium]|nr:flagellar hook-associated protein 2 [Bacillota bacterium]